LLVWDADTKTEHLVFSTTFEGATHSFAFLVPVPNVPVIAAADETVFDQLEQFWQARRPSDASYTFGGLGSALLSGAPEPMDLEQPVQLLAKTHVAGLDAAVLDGGSPSSVADWLHKNGYDFREQLSGWLEPYLRDGYKLVAFKFGSAARVPRVGSRAVRLSFKAPRPFYPYREPSDASAPGPRTLRLYAVGATSFNALRGEGPWGGAVRYSGPLRDVSLPFSGITSPWATFFEETSGSRATAGDLFLRATPTPSLVRAAPRPVQETLILPVELVLVALGAGVFFWLRRRRGPANERELAEPE
jgi:hypothetical protein